MTADTKRLLWRCRRGMRELDQLLVGWVLHCYESASETDRQRFDDLLGLQDPDIMAMMNGSNRDSHYAAIIEQIREHPAIIK